MTWFFAPPPPHWWDRFRRGKRVPASWQDIGYVTDDDRYRAGEHSHDDYSAGGEDYVFPAPRKVNQAHFVRLPFEVDPDMLDALSALFSQGVSYLLREGARLSTIRAQVETDLSDGSWHLTMRGSS